MEAYRKYTQMEAYRKYTQIESLSKIHAYEKPIQNTRK